MKPDISYLSSGKSSSSAESSSSTSSSFSSPYLTGDSEGKTVFCFGIANKGTSDI